MKTYITSISGGTPLQGDDLELIQVNVKNITSEIAKGLSLGESAFIISGCEITVSGSGGGSPTLGLTSGSIWYSDEIYLVDSVISQALPAGTTQTQVETIYEWDLVSSDSKTVVFKNLASNTVHNDRKAHLIITGSTWSGIKNLKTIPELFKTQVISDIVLTDNSPSGEYSVSGYRGKYMVDENFRSCDFECEILNASPAINPEALKIKANSVYLMDSGAYIPIKALYNSVLEDMYLKVISNTPTEFEVYRQPSGTTFANSSTVKLWYNGVKHL